MPRVPTYDTLQASPTALPQVRVGLPDMPDIAGQQAQMLGRGLQQAGQALGQIALDRTREANQIRVNDGMNQLVKTRTAMQIEVMGLKGRNALERPDGKALSDEYEEKLGKEIKALSASLGNDAQRLQFKQQADQMTNQFRGAVTEHMVREQKEFKKETLAATLDTATSQAVLLWGDKAMREQSTAAITNTVAEMAAEEGWDDTIRMQKLAAAITPMHAGIMKGMIQAGRAAEAQAYYDEHSAGMTLQGRAAVSEPLQRAVVTQGAEQAVDQELAINGPAGPNDPFLIAQMSKNIREQYKGQPDMVSAAETELKERMQLHNAEQTERTASNKAAVWGLIGGGAPMRAVQRSDAWLSLSGTEQRDIKDNLARGAATSASTELTRLQTQDRLLGFKNAPLYLQASDPAWLAKASRNEVMALSGQLPRDQIDALLKKQEGLKDPEKLKEAKMDADDFKVVAADMGITTFGEKASTKSQAIAARAKMDIEQIIAAREKSTGKTTSRDERRTIARQAMASTVMLDRSFGFDVEVRASLVDPDEIKNVIVPQNLKPLIAQSLEAGYRKAPNNPLYAPTEENMARMYLQYRMRGGE